jgi:hypothetical protein
MNEGLSRPTEYTTSVQFLIPDGKMKVQFKLTDESVIVPDLVNRIEGAMFVLPFELKYTLLPEMIIV